MDIKINGGNSDERTREDFERDRGKSEFSRMSCEIRKEKRNYHRCM